MAKSSGSTISRANGSTCTDADDSTVSAIVLKPIQRPVYRLIAQPTRPRSRMSCTPAGLRVGIIALTNSSSEPCGRVELRQL